MLILECIVFFFLFHVIVCEDGNLHSNVLSCSFMCDGTAVCVLLYNVHTAVC